MNNSLIIIPARGGSKGVLRKNVRTLVGKPLIAHTIEQAFQATRVSRVVVSTDNPEIAAISEQYRADVIWRPAEISGDSTSSEEALMHVLTHLSKNEQYHPELTVFLQCTSPLTQAKDIDGTVQALVDQQADSALAVTPFHYFLWHQDENGFVNGINHDQNVRFLRQQQEPQYLETGAVYVMRTQGFLEAKHRFFGKIAMYVMPPKRCLEIDAPLDFQIAEMLLREQQLQQQINLLPDPVAALVLDFDGVFTDNKVSISQNGQEAVVCDRSDGLGLAQLKKLGLPILVLSSEQNPVVQARCDKLGIPCRHGLRDKLAALNDWLAECGLEHSRVVYVGNDTNDLACMLAVGCGVAVADSHPQVISAARIVLTAKGGKGAIRQLCDMILQVVSS
jgi:YrbI family 3-deoxy-D-manno-octulosonate 8-phosphate phosphatase